MITLIKAVRKEILALMRQSTIISKTLETAKTRTKRSVYRKKLKRINNKAADLIIALDDLEKEEEKDHHPSDD